VIHVCERRSAGFGLLEAIVALALIAATGLALFSWVGTNLTEAARLHDRDAAARLQMAAVEFMANVNPVGNLRGERSVGAMQLTWNAVAKGDEAPGMSFIGTPSNYRLQLFDSTVDASDSQSGARTQFHLTVLGYRKVEIAAAMK
jgi:general secretion pathway protein I